MATHYFRTFHYKMQIKDVLHSMENAIVKCTLIYVANANYSRVSKIVLVILDTLVKGSEQCKIHQ